MAARSEEEHGTCDEFFDPFCDICYEGKGINVRVYGYCKNCFQFLCSDCHVMHGKFQLAKGHVVLRGANMPQSQADKPPKFDNCDVHPKLLRDEFCSEHKVLVCSSCSSTDHDKCFVGSIDDVCKDINASEIDLLYNSIKTVHDQVGSIRSSFETNIQKLVEEKKTALKEAQDMYDKVIAKVNQLFQELQSEIETTYKSQEVLISQQQEKMDGLINKLESILTDSENIKGKPIETKLFLKVQKLIANTGKIIDECRAFGKSFCLKSLSFTPNREIQEMLNRSVAFGSVSTPESKLGLDIVVTDIVFPRSQIKPPMLPPRQYRQSSQPSQPSSCSKNKPPKAVTKVPPQQVSQCSLPSQQSIAAGFQAANPPIPVSQVKATKHHTLKVCLKHNPTYCDITGMVKTKNRKTILVDNGNNSVKLLSHDMKLLSAVSIPKRPLDIAVLSDKEAVVTTWLNSLAFLDISGNQLSIKATRDLSYDVRGINRYKDKLVVASPNSEHPSVKLIDQTGRVYLSVPFDQQRKSLFIDPQYVSSRGDGMSSTVLVTDQGNNTLTLLCEYTGEVINRRQWPGKGPSGVTTDPTGNVYVCYSLTQEIAVLSGDLSEQKILLSRQDGLSPGPQAILYDDTNNQLIISYARSSYIDYFQLS